MADVFHCPIRRIAVANSAALGAALRAAHGWLAHSGNKPKWHDVVAGFTDPIPNGKVKPNAEAARVYNKLVGKYVKCGARVLQNLK